MGFRVATGVVTLYDVADGAEGPRGSSQFYITGTSWTDPLALQAITNGGFDPQLYDRVTISSSVGPFSKTKFIYENDPIVWQDVDTVIDGNLIVDGIGIFDEIGTTSINVGDYVKINTEAYNEVFASSGKIRVYSESDNASSFAGVFSNPDGNALGVDGLLNVKKASGTALNVDGDVAITAGHTLTIGGVDISSGASGNFLPATHDMLLTINGDATGTATFTNMGNATLNLAVADDSHSHSQLFIPDTRGAIRPPSYYPDKHVSYDFQNRNDTLAGDDSWQVLQTIAKWGSYSPNHPQQQIAYTGPQLKHRAATSESAWGTWKTIWDSSNFGTTQIDALGFVHKVGDSTIDGKLTIGGSSVLTNSGGEIKFTKAPQSTHTSDPYIDSYQNTLRYVSFVGGVTRILTIPSESGTVLHSNSVINASTLGGSSPATGTSAGSIVKRTTSGDINARLLRSTYANQSTISGAMAFRINNSSNNYNRYCSDIGAIRTYLSVFSKSESDAKYGTLSGTNTWTGANTFTRNGYLAVGKIGETHKALMGVSSVNGEFLFGGSTSGGTTSMTNYLRLGTSNKLQYTSSGSTKTVYHSGNLNSNTDFSLKSLVASGTLTGSDVIATSDIRVKQDLQPILNASNKLRTLRTTTHERTDHEKINGRYPRKASVIAQDVEAVLPEAINYIKDEELGHKLNVSVPATVVMTIAAINEHTDTIAAQAKTIASLEERLARLEEMLING